MIEPAGRRVAAAAVGAGPSGPSGGASTRERILVGTLVDLADTLADDGDPEVLLAVACHRCAALLGAGAEVAIVIGGALDVAPAIGSSGERARFLATFDPGDGSSLGAAALASGTGATWPRDREPDEHAGFSLAARSAGIGAALAMPLRCGARVSGALLACREDDTPFPAGEVAVARAIGDAAAASFVQWRARRDSATLAAQLQRALDSRVVLEQAKGVVAEAAGVAVGEAFRRLRKYARDHNRTLADTAMRVVSRTLPDVERAELLAPSPAPG